LEDIQHRLGVTEIGPLERRVANKEIPMVPALQSWKDGREFDLVAKDSPTKE